MSISKWRKPAKTYGENQKKLQIGTAAAGIPQYCSLGHGGPQRGNIVFTPQTLSSVVIPKRPLSVRAFSSARA